MKRGAFNFYNTPEVGEHKLKIDAGQKYRAAELKLTYTAAEALPTLALQGEAKQNADVTVNVEGLSAERLAAKLAKVELSNSEESGLRRLMTATEGGTSSDDYYELSGTQLILKGGLFKTTGNYSLYLKFTDAKAPVKVDFTVAAAEATPEQPTVEEKAAPSGATLGTNRGVFGSETVLNFEGLSGEELGNYLSKITELRVNGTVFEKSNFSYGLGAAEYVLKKDAYGRNNALALGSTAAAAGEKKIEIMAEGYAKLSVTIPAEGGASAPETPAVETKAAPTAAQAEKVTPRQGYDSGTKEVYDLTFTGLDADALDTYLRAKITKLTVNGKRYTEAQSKSYLFSMDDKYATLFDRTYKKNGVRLSANGFTEASNEVVLEVEGYEPFRFTVERASAEESENEATAGKAVPTGAVLEKVIPRQGYDIGSKPAYALSFEGLEDEALDTWLRSDDLEVSVNGKNLSSVHANYIHLYDDRFAFSLKRYRRAGLTLSGNLFESGSNEVTVKAGGYQVGSFTLTVE